ncbi:MAG: tetratricopeptide repeat protein [Myxococcales bacterium]|nr:tetratricopeptide repeat protein [Myxococcales bacterium]MCB9549356.1 tetratricopeptide repeat protein [Myxococcales bacterium]
MVKRIRKRIPKAEAPEGVTEGAEELEEAVEEAPPADLAAELDAMGEDGFTRRTAGLFKWVVEKRKLLLGGLVVVAGGAAAYAYSQRHSAAAAEEASAAFQAGAGPYVEAHRAGPDAKGADEKKVSIEKAAREFESARSAYGERRVAALATLGLASAKFDLGQLDEAIKLYDDFLGRPDTDPFAKALALQGKAAAQEQKGDLPGAIATWKLVEGLDRDAYGLMAGVSVGRLMEAQGKGGEARAHYEKLQKDYSAALEDLPNRPVKVELERRLSALAGPG